jgi:hypothetical protein
MDSSHMVLALETHHFSQGHHAALMKDPRLQPLCTRGFGNECGHLFQKNIPQDRKITYGKIVWDYKKHKKGRNVF